MRRVFVATAAILAVFTFGTSPAKGQANDPRSNIFQKDLLFKNDPQKNPSQNPNKDSQKNDSAQKEDAPDVPDSIQAPAGEEVILYAHATGSQIYTCQAASDGKFNWTLKAPEAELHDRKDKVIGQHGAGPSWKLKDGSEVTGKAAAKVDSLDPDSIPWLLVKVVSHAGKGTLDPVTTIQRIHTHGGQPPATGCDASHRDTETKVSYSADYYFYAPGTPK